MMLEKNMLVDDGWQVFEPFRHTVNKAPIVRVAKGGRRLYINAAVWEALGRPELARILWDRARCRVAVEPAKAGEENVYAVRKVSDSPRRELEFGALSKVLDLAVERTMTVPHELVGFRLIVDLRALRAKGDGA